MPNSRTSDTFHLNEEDLSRLVRERDRVARHLDKVGFTNAEIQAALHYNPADISERRSAACPYEQERARRLVLHHFRGRAGDAYLVTAGNPCLRAPLDNIDDIDVAAALRPFRTACERLAAVGERVRGFAVFELHACYLTEGEPFLEPHFHAILWGPSRDALKEAFNIRVPKAISHRRRPVHIQPVYELERALGYCLKIRPTITTQYYSPDGKLRWRNNRMPSSLESLWHGFLARHRLAQLLTFRAENMSVLRQPMQCELS